MSRNSRNKPTKRLPSRPAPEEGQTTTSLTRFEAAFFQGPLPPPQALARYEEICPGAADRILSMAEGQARHRQELEKQVIASNCRAQDRGPIIGLIIALTVIFLGGYLLLNDKETAGLVALVSALAAIVVPFVYGKQEQKKELEEKREELTSPWDYSAE